MIPAKHHRHQADVPADISQVRVTRDGFARYLSDCGVETAAAENWLLVFTEAFSNAAKHSTKGATDTVRVEWWQDAEKGEIVLEIENEGAGPTESEAEDATLPEDAHCESGRGMYMIRKLVDRTEHWRCGDRYRLVMACSHGGLVPDTGIDGNLELALEELENTYEHLAAFHSLGNALINSRPAGDVIRDGIAALADAQTERPDLVRIGICRESLLEPLSDDLLQIPEVVEGDMLPGAAWPILKGGGTLLWGESDGTHSDPELARYRSGCCLPIVAGEVTLGVLLVARRGGRPDMLSSEISRYQTFADLFAISLANANLLLLRDRQLNSLREFEIATEIQRAVLNIPAAPVSDLWELILKRQSAKDVAGDYVEAVLDSEGRLVMSIVDVMGKGVSAAILASLFRTALHSHLQRAHELPDLVESINRTLCRQIGDMTMFLTCLIARLDVASGRLEVVNAGHCPLLLMRASGASQEILPTGSPLGLFPDDTFPAESQQFFEGDSLAMITDGLYEWESNGSPWGWDAFADVAISARSDGEHLWQNLQERIASSGSTTAAEDDRTLLHFRLLERYSAKRSNDAPAPPQHGTTTFARRTLKH